jgi:uncharacterized protein YjbI with pentapeptide repeats
MMHIKTLGGAVLFEHDAKSLGELVQLAVKQGENLGRADLAGANLAGANLSGANLSGACLVGANMPMTSAGEKKGYTL